MPILRYFIIPLVFFLPFSAPAAEPAPLDMNARYEFDWNGIALGRVTVGIHETATDYAMHAVVDSKGIVSLFASHHSDTTVKGRRANGRYVASVYETRYNTRKKFRHVKIVYDEAGRVKEQVMEPPDPDSPVTQADKDHASDLLTTVLRIRRELSLAWQAKKTRYDFDMYDGRRIAHLHFAVVGESTRRVNGKPYSVLAVMGTRTPGPGYSEKDRARMKDEPGMMIYFSNDAKLMPLAIEIHYLGNVRGDLSLECKSFEECR
jgi:hypothetical protein